MTADNRPRCTLAQLRARWGHTTWSAPLRVGDDIAKDTMAAKETWRVEKIEGKDVHLVQVAAAKEETT